MANHSGNHLTDFDPAWLDYFLSTNDWSASNNEPHIPQTGSDGDEKSFTRADAWATSSYAEPEARCSFGGTSSHSTMLRGEAIETNTEWLEESSDWSSEMIQQRSDPHLKPEPAMAQEKSSNNQGAFSCTAQGCERTFRYPKDLRRHILTHTGARPHPCPVAGCQYGGKGFSRKDALLRHIKSVHRDAQK